MTPLLGTLLAALALTAGAPTTTTLSPAGQEATRGDTTSWDAQVAPADGGGTVTFLVDGVAQDGCAAVSVDDDGDASCDNLPPAAVGAHAVTVRFSGTDDDAGSTSAASTLQVDGSALTVSGADGDAVAFGPVLVGADSPAKTIIFTNTGNYADRATDDPNFDRVHVTGPDAALFDVADDDCFYDDIAVGARCPVAITFSPEAVGARTAQLEFDAEDATRTFTLSGTGVAPDGGGGGVVVTRPPSSSHGGGKRSTGSGGAAAPSATAGGGVAPQSRAPVAAGAVRVGRVVVGRAQVSLALTCAAACTVSGRLIAGRRTLGTLKATRLTAGARRTVRIAITRHAAAARTARLTLTTRRADGVARVSTRTLRLPAPQR